MYTVPWALILWLVRQKSDACLGCQKIGAALNFLHWRSICLPLTLLTFSLVYNYMLLEKISWCTLTFFPIGAKVLGNILHGSGDSRDHIEQFVKYDSGLGQQQWCKYRLSCGLLLIFMNRGETE